MILDGLDSSAMPAPHYDVCVVGAGAAGITLARKLATRSLSICVLEAGGRAFDPAQQDIYAGPYEGSFAAEEFEYLRTSRTRMLGGTTNYWTGYCAPLQESCFEPRPGIAPNGWPIRAADLAPYYPEAAEILQITPPVHDSDAGYSESRKPLLVHRPHLRTLNFHLSPPTRFGDVYGAELAAADNVHLLLNTTAAEVSMDGDRVTAIHTRDLAGNRRTIGADHFVLAAGGIENSRLLLLWNRAHGNRLGNRHDQVGRYFMDHASVHMAGSWFRELPHAALNAYLFQQFDEVRRHHTKAALTVSPEWIARRGLPNFLVHAGFMAPGPGPEASALISAARAIDEMRGATPAGGFPEYFQLITEPPLDADNRVTVIDEPDELGLPRTRVRFRLPPDYPDTCRRCMRALAEAVGAEGIGRGRVYVDPDMGRWPESGQFTHLQDHHNGGTRMSTGEKTGVVDANCRVHGTDNLHVASSSVFTTGGVPNPTFTIVALTLRLADHLVSA